MDDVKLISLVQNYKCLYDKRSPGFNSAIKKRDAWEDISKELNTSVDICTRRWVCLRERFSRENRKYGHSGSENEVWSSWHLYSDMIFLQPHVKQRRLRCSANIRSDIQSETHVECSETTEDLKYFEISSSPAHRIDFKSKQSCFPSDFLDGCGKMFRPLSSDPLSEYQLPSLTPSTSSSNRSPTPSTSSNSRKRKELAIESAFLEAVTCFKKLCEAQTSSKNAAVEAFGQMITATVSEMSALKQAKAIKEVTALVMAINTEPE